MAECLKPADWLSVMKKEYLQDFIREGGTAVKFVIPLEGDDFQQIKSGLQGIAEQENYACFLIDAANVKVHLTEQIFFQIARQVDWDNLTLSFLHRLLQEHYRLPEAQEEFNLKKIAELNGYEEREIRVFVNTRLKDSLFRNYAMTQEFRIAMLMLCHHQLDSEEVPDELCFSIKAWLRGELRLISALKRALIFQKIGRHNARNMLFSLTHWLRLCGWNGMMLTLDISRYLQDRSKESADTLYYSISALLDCYEVLRQFVDDADESEYCFITVLAPSRFLDESDRRSVDVYDALKLRIWNEVRDKRYVNPLSPMIRVSCCENASG
ncbi:MAG: DUF2791 family P-loop domain-containing protein [Dehalococcoidales bacterium]|nr:DUF2791 family P-loop domain-containing protein [Dehalococcoidales bacterium]